MSHTVRHTDALQAKASLLNAGKKGINNMYEQGLDTVSQVEENIKEYSGKVVEGVKHYPVTTALIVGSISVLLALLLRRR
jgi:hypothetical protein